MVSKYNKAAAESGGVKAQAAQIVEMVSNEMNLRLEDEGEDG
jgi:hypothetical protein